jgi:hypothetical protein
MKQVSVLGMLAVLGLFVAGCGSAKKGGAVSVVLNTVDTSSPPGTIFVTGTKTFPNPKPGTPIACKGGEPRVKVPATGVVEVGAAVRRAAVVGGSGSSPETRLDLTRNSDGRVTVTCNPG